MKPLGLLLPIVVAVALIGLPSIGEAQVQRPARVVDGAHRGYLAVRLLGGGEHEVIDELNADRLFVPASVLKVVTVAAVLEHLGTEYRWLTRLRSNGAIAGAVLDGDLVIEPGADPTWGAAFFDGGGAAPLAALAHQVRERGLTRISGDLVVDASRFPGRLHPTDRSYGDLPYRHGTPPAALAVDEATITVRVAPGASVGEPARVSAPAGVEVINHTTTVGRGGHGTLDFVPLWGTNTLLLRGEYPLSEGPFVVSASDPAPELRVARQLREALGEAGVTVEGIVRLQPQAVRAPDQLVALAELRSRPLEDVLERILTNSHNWYADMLTLTLGLEVAGSGRFEDGVEVISDFVTGLLKRFSNRPCTTWGGRGTSAHTDAGGPMRAYSMDLRERALLDSDAGMKAADVAAKYRVSGSWVRLLKQRRRETGEVAPRVQRHGRRCMLEPHLHTLAALIAAHPDRTLAELKDALATPASVPTVWRAVRALGLTVKKTVRPSEHDRPDVAAARVAWHAAAPTWDVAHLVCLDETGITTNLLRRYGRAPRGARVHDHAPCGRWQTSTFLAALRVTGLTAPGVFDGAIDGESFRAYIDQILVPTLQPGDIVIADNLGAHKVAGIQRALQAAGATLWYLPPYSPDLNPIELCFAKLKALVRTARCRRTETLWPFLGECLAHFSPDECRNYVRHCGYSAATRS